MAPSEVSGDVVLLFETKDGWNQAGGAEIVSTEHHDGEGCNVAYVDTHVMFENTKRLSELQWTVGGGRK
jgi:prepilin-type processing-associated H-X9-DG protein